MTGNAFFDQNLAPEGASGQVVSVAGVAVLICSAPPILDEILYSVGHLPSSKPPILELTVIRRQDMKGSLPKFETSRRLSSDEVEFEYLPELDAIACRGSDNRALLVLGDDSPTLARPEGMRILIDWLLDGRGLVALHGATVGWGERTALISNRGGSGKSSTTAACVVAGAKTCGDDFLLGDRDFEVHSVSRTVKLAESSPAKALYANVTPGAQASFESAPGEFKELYLLDQLVPGSMLASAKPDVIWIPRVSDGWRLGPISEFDVLQAVAPNSVAMNRDRAGALSYVRQMIAGLPCFSLEVGPDLVAGAEFLRRELAR